MVPAAKRGMTTPDRERNVDSNINASRLGGAHSPRRDESSESDVQHGSARRSFARRIDCSGRDAERSATRAGHRPAPRTPNGRNPGGGGQAA